MPIHHTPDHPDSFGIAYTGEACRQHRHEDCPAWWGRGRAGTRCDCSCHLPEASVSSGVATTVDENCPRWREPSHWCACPCHHPGEHPG